MVDPGLLATQLLQKNFPKFGSFRKSCVYHSMLDMEYDPETGSTTEIPNPENPPQDLYIIFDEFGFTKNQSGERQNLEEPILSIDKKAIFPSLDLPFMPRVNDQIVDEENLVWIVIGISEDPKPAHFELHVRPRK